MIGIHRKLSSYEIRVVDVLKGKTHASAAEIAATLYSSPEEAKAKICQVSVVLKRLEKKGYVERLKKEGRNAFYRAIVEPRAVPAAATDEMIRDFAAYFEHLHQRTPKTVKKMVEEIIEEARQASASDIAKKIFPEHEMSRVKVSQIYVTLKRLEREGKVQRIDTEGRKTHFRHVPAGERHAQPAPAQHVPVRHAPQLAPQAHHIQHPAPEHRPAGPRMPRMPPFHVPRALPLAALVVLLIGGIYMLYPSSLGFITAPGQALELALDQQQADGLQSFVYGVSNVNTHPIRQVKAEAVLPEGSNISDTGGAEVTQRGSATVLTWMISQLHPSESQTFAFAGQVPGQITLFAEGLSEREESVAVPELPAQAELPAGQYQYRPIEQEPKGYLGRISISLSAGPLGAELANRTVTIPEMPLPDVTENVTEVPAEAPAPEQNKTEAPEQNATEQPSEAPAEEQPAEPEQPSPETGAEPLPPTAGIVMPAGKEPVTTVKAYLDPDTEQNGNEDLIEEIGVAGQWEGTISSDLPERKYNGTINLAFYSDNGAVIKLNSVNLIWAVEVPVNASRTFETETNITANETNITAEIYVVDSEGRPQKSDVAVKDSAGRSVSEASAGGAQIMGGETKRHRFAVKEGLHSVRIAPSGSPVKQLMMSGVEMRQSMVIGIDDAPGFEGAVQTYSIDPTSISFESAEVTVTAAGSALYKCKEWNFTGQACGGDWTFVMDITPRQDYTFTLTPEDPAFAEVASAMSIVECTENGAAGTCSLAAIQADDTSYEQFRVGRNYVLNRLNTSHANTSIPGNAMITNAVVCILAYRDSILGDDAGDRCLVQAGENATGSPTYATVIESSRYTCLNWTTSVGNPNLVCGNATSFIRSKPDPAASARKMLIVFNGTEQSDNGVDLWIDWMYVNISYTTPPLWSSQGQNTSVPPAGAAVLLSAYWSDNSTLGYAWLETNETGAWQNKTAYGSPHNFSGAAAGWSNFTWQNSSLAGATVAWRIHANNSGGQQNSTGVMTFTIPQDSPPNATLVSPPNGTQTTNTSLDLTCSATDDLQLANITLYWNYSGSWQANGTENVSGKENSTTFQRSGLDRKAILWSCRACDSADQCSFAAANWTATIKDGPPASSSPPDQAVELGSSGNSLTWTLTDDIGGGYYKVQKNGTDHVPWTAWTNNTNASAIIDTYVLGTWNYTIYFNDSAGNSGTPDSALVTVQDTVIPNCTPGGDGPTLTSITVDGSMGDWDAVLQNPANIISDGIDGINDLDNPVSADRDIVSFAYTWDSQYLYLYFRRVAVGNNIATPVVYVDYKRDGYMNSTDKVLRFTWSGSNRKYSSLINNYVPAAGADPITGDGSTMPGSITNETALETNVQGGDASGILLETRVSWSALGVPAGAPLALRPAMAQAGGSNLPAQIEDNMNATSTAYTNLLFQPDNVGSGTIGASVLYLHDIRNCGNLPEPVDLSHASSQGWPVTLYFANGTALADTNGNGLNDTGMLAANGHMALLVNVTIPAGASEGDKDVTTITASGVAISNRSVTDTTTTGKISIMPDRSGVIRNNTLISYNFTIKNSQAGSDTIEVKAASNNSWAASLHHANGTALADTDGDGSPDIGSLNYMESRDVVLRILVPGVPAGTADATLVSINSSITPGYTTNATARTLVAERIEIVPDFASASAGIGATVFYPFRVYNNWNESDRVDITNTTVKGWAVTYYAADMITELSDTNGNGRIDTGLIGPNGEYATIYARVFVPGTALEGETEQTRMYGNSSSEPPYFDSALMNTTARKMLTYNNSMHTLEDASFAQGEAVYAKTFGLDAKNVYFMWIDANGTTVRISPIVAVDTNKQAWDSYQTNSTSALGNWTAITYNSQNNAELARTYFEVTDGVPPRWLSQSQSADAVAMYGNNMLSANWTDNADLDYAWLATNDSGTWKNVSYADINLTAGQTWANFTWSNSSVEGNSAVAWRIYANDSRNNQNATAVMTFTVIPTVAISLVRDTVEFGTMLPGQTNETGDNSPLPFEVRNDGNVKVNITVNATDLWNYAANPSQYYRAAANVSEANAYSSACTLTNFINMPSAQTLVACFLHFADPRDQFELELNVTVPGDEGAGLKNSTVMIFATQA